MRISNQDLDTLIEKLKQNSLSEIEYQDDDFRIKLKDSMQNDIAADSFLKEKKQFEVQSNQQNTVLASGNENQKIKSNLIGNFYLTKTPDSPALVNVGDYVKKGQVIAVVEAMKLIHEIKSELEGTITNIFVESGQFVDLDTDIFEIDTKE